MNRRLVLLAISLSAIGVVITLFFYSRVMDISIPYRLPEFEPIAGRMGREVVSVGVISRYPANIIMKGYQPIMDYLSSVTPYQFELQLSTNYEQTLRQLTEGKVSAAFFGTYLYVTSHRQHNLTPILKPLNENFEPFFRSVLIVPVSSNITSVAQLRGKRVALPSKESFSGNWLIRAELPKLGMSIKDLAQADHFAHHHSVVYQVLKGNYDAGVIRDYLAKQYLQRGVKIISASEPIPGSPIVVSAQTNPAHVKALKEALLAIDINQQHYRELLASWDKEFTHGFVPARNEDYEYVRRVILRGAK